MISLSREIFYFPCSYPFKSLFINQLINHYLVLYDQRRGMEKLASFKARIFFLSIVNVLLQLPLRNNSMFRHIAKVLNPMKQNNIFFHMYSLWILIVDVVDFSFNV
jgi:hypothetical protein